MKKPKPKGTRQEQKLIRDLKEYLQNLEKSKKRKK